MDITLTPILTSLREIYDAEGVMHRFQAYLSLMLGTARGEPYPLGVFSPMGRRQPEYLDALIALRAESVAEDAAAQALAKLSSLPDVFRLMLVVVDEKHNSWTERYITDAEWRLQNKYDELHQAAAPVGFDRWVTIQLWTDVEPSTDYIMKETQAAVYRAAHRAHVGAAATLEQMMNQEGRAMAFAGYTPELDDDDIAYSRQAIRPHQHSNHYPTCFAGLYGDDIARAVGYQPLGLSTRAGFDVALSNALQQVKPEQWLGIV